MNRFTLKLAVLAVLCIAPAAHASEPDVVVVKSGNRMTGSVSELSRGTLTFSIEGAGSVDINWHNVVSLQSSQNLDVHLASGVRYAGTVSSPAEGKLEIKTASGPQVVDMKDVVRIKPVEATFGQRTSGSIDLGFEVLQANDEIDLTLNAEVENRTKNYLTTTSFDSLWRRRNGDDNQLRNFFDVGSRRYLARRWFVLGQFDIQQDQEMDLDFRTLVSGSLGRTLVENNHAVFAAYAGFDYNHENYGGEPTSNSGEALAAVEWDIFGDAHKTEWKTEAKSYYALNQARIRLQLDTDIKRYIYKKIYGKLNFFESFDSRPPVGQEGNDYGLTITIGRSF